MFYVIICNIACGRFFKEYEYMSFRDKKISSFACKVCNKHSKRDNVTYYILEYENFSPSKKVIEKSKKFEAWYKEKIEVKPLE